MQTIKVKRSDLISKMTTNRAIHIEEYNVAKDGYRQKVQEELLKIIESNKTCEYHDIEVHARVPYPETHQEEYDRVIAMLEMSVDDTIELTHQEFNQYVRDIWSWSNSFASNTKTYSSGIHK